VDADAHVQLHAGPLPRGRDGADHEQPHLDAAVRVVWPRHGQPGHAVVAVPEQLDAQAVLLGGEPVEAREQVVEDLHQLLGAAAARQGGEPFDVREQDAHVLVAVEVDLVELVRHEGALLLLAGDVLNHLPRHEVGEN